MRLRYRAMARRLLPIVAALAGAAGAFACACCADTGTWYERTARLQPFERAELTRVRFAADAHDVPSPRGDVRSYTLAVSRSATTWTFALSGLRPLVLRLPL